MLSRLAGRAGLARLAIASTLALLATPALAAPVEITTRVLSEQRQSAADGTTSVKLVPAARVVPGDRVVYEIGYRNTGTAPVSNIVVANPVPKQMTYAGPAQGSAQPEVSTDGTSFAMLSALRVRGADGSQRAATMGDVRVVRWRVTTPVAGGAGGQLAYRAILK
jgi:uncharacterized repeat protein (TIGR01451 family)